MQMCSDNFTKHTLLFGTSLQGVTQATFLCSPHTPLARTPKEIDPLELVPKPNFLTPAKGQPSKQAF